MGGLGKATSERLESLLRACELRHEPYIATDPSVSQALSRRCGTTVVRIVPRAYARRSYWEHLSPRAQHVHVLRALAKKHPTWTFCSTSAAVAHGLYVSHQRFSVVHVVGTHRQRMRREGVHIVFHDAPRCLPKADEGLTSTGLRVTSLPQTVLDATRMLPFPEALAVVDSSMRHHRVEREELCSHAERLGQRSRGIETTRRAIAWGDPRSENGGESIVRGLMIEFGFVVPELQVEIPDPLGGPIYRVDYLWRLGDDRVVIGELDGLGKTIDAIRTSDRALADHIRRERSREANLTVRGASVMRIPSSVMRNPDELVRLMSAYGIPRAADTSRRR